MGDFDPVANPVHYAEGRTIQPIDVIDDWGLDFNEGQVLKYLSRWRRKNGVEDLRKCRFYLDRLIGDRA